MPGDWLKRQWAGLRGTNVQVWTARQRLALATLVLALVVGLMIIALGRPLHINDPQPVAGARSHELATKIDPNEADWPTLAALPSIGEKRAKEIVAYRDEFVRKTPARRAFEKIEDLDNVKGIGESTADALRPYLIIPPRAAAP
jgi:DNA uptake protein ComE-like DNA-binding protein